MSNELEIIKCLQEAKKSLTTVKRLLEEDTKSTDQLTRMWAMQQIPLIESLLTTRAELAIFY